jgi:hypothetical protein
MTTHQNPVASVSSAQAALETKRRLPRLLCEGTEAMRAAGRTYLPQWPAEPDKAWEARRDSTVLFPAFRDAVDLACGLIFRKPVEPQDVPWDAQGWLLDIDRAGRDVTQFAEAVGRDAITCGVSYIVADYPRVNPGLTLAQERAMGARPYLIHVKAEQVLGWRSQMVNGAEVLTQFRYLESVTVQDGAYGEKVAQRIRVLQPGLVEVYVKAENGKDWVLDPEASGVVTMMEVPVVAVYAGRTGFMAGTPPLIDLAWKNVEHWQSSSDQRNVLHVARVPLLTRIGWVDPGGDTTVSASMSLDLPIGGDAKFVEHSGAAIGAGRQDIEDLKAEMRVMAGKILDAGVQKTAYQAGVESAQAMSRVQAWALGLQSALNAAWALCGKWIGQELGTLSVNSDVDLTKPDAQTLVELRNAVLAGLLTRRTYLQILKEAEVLPSGVTVEDEEERLGEESPELPIPPRVSAQP